MYLTRKSAIERLVILAFLHFYSTGQRVAIKVIKRRSSLENEKHALKLNHENVTKIKEVFDKIEYEKTAILVLEYVGQYNMQALIEQQSSKLTVKLTKR